MAEANYLRAVPKSKGGGDGIDGEQVEHRLTALETRLDAVLPGLSTKADVSELKADMVKWIVGTAIALGGIGIGIVSLVVSNAAKSPAPTMQPSQPVIINIPTQPAAPLPPAPAPAPPKKG